MKYLSLAIIAGFFAFTACGPGQQRDDQAGTEDTTEPALPAPEEEEVTEEPAEDVNTLKDMAGQAITVDSLTSIDEVDSRLKRTLSDNYDRFKEFAQTEGQAQMEGDLFYVFFTQQSGSTDPGSAFMIDFASDEVFAGVKNGEDIQAFAEKGSDIPGLMEKWAMGQL